MATVLNYSSICALESSEMLTIAIPSLWTEKAVKICALLSAWLFFIVTRADLKVNYCFSGAVEEHERRVADSNPDDMWEHVCMTMPGKWNFNFSDVWISEPEDLNVSPTMFSCYKYGLKCNFLWSGDCVVVGVVLAVGLTNLRIGTGAI